MAYKDLSISNYLDLLSAKKSTPGGGSALALTLDVAISLCYMVIRFTIDKKGYEKVQNELIEQKKIVDSLKEMTDKLIDEDSESFLSLMDAYRSKDKVAISEASVLACEVPYKLYLTTENVQRIAELLILKGNKNVVSDAKIARDLCLAIYPGCILNIKANIVNILDIEQADKYKTIL